MRRTYISPEFIYQKVNGTFNMQEHSSFFGSKMIEIDDEIVIKNDNIIWHQLPSGEQLNANTENGLPDSSYDAVISKKNNHSLEIDISQSDFDKDNNTKWILDIEIRIILRDYIFALMKKFRTFNGVSNNMTTNNNVNAAIISYIDNNILNRYKFKKVEFFLQPFDLLTVGGLMYDNKFDMSIESKNTLFTKIQTITDPNDVDVKLIFNQDANANRFSFNYYFNLFFEKL